MIKKFIFSIIAIFGVLMFTSCEEEEVLKETNSEYLEDLNMSRVGMGHRIEVREDFVEIISPGCYLINVRVYFVNLDTGQNTLVANQNVQVGNGCGDGSNNKTMNPNQTNNCQGGYLLNGNYVVEVTNYNYDYCLLDLLLKNEEIYNQYLIKIQQYY